MSKPTGNLRRDQAIVGKYDQKSISQRIEAFFLDNIGKVATRAQIQRVARDPKTGKEPENWHQRLPSQLQLQQRD